MSSNQKPISMDEYLTNVVKSIEAGKSVIINVKYARRLKAKWYERNPFKNLYEKNMSSNEKRFLQLDGLPFKDLKKEQPEAGEVVWAFTSDNKLIEAVYENGIFIESDLLEVPLTIVTQADYWMKLDYNRGDRKIKAQ